MGDSKEKTNGEVKIDDVARIAGVSKSTVSRVMNRPYLVQDRTVKKVRKVMERLNYVPNTVAQSMRLQRTKTIGVHIPDLKNTFYSAMLCEIENDLKKHDYMMMICPSTGTFEEEKDYMARMMQRRVDGIIFFTYNNTRRHVDSILSIARDVPFILMDESSDELNVNQVVTNGYAGTRDAVEYLIGKGHSRIAFVRADAEAGTKRFEGYCVAMKAHGLDLIDEYIFSSGFDIEDGAKVGERIMALKERPTAVVCIADSIAAGLVRALVAGGVHIPSEMEILGFNNSEVATIITPQLSSIGQNMRELSRQSVQLIMDLIENPDRRKHVNIIKIETELVLRQTTR